MGGAASGPQYQPQGLGAIDVAGPRALACSDSTPRCAVRQSLDAGPAISVRVLMDAPWAPRYATTSLQARNRYRLPVRLFVGAFAFEAQHSAFGHQRLDAGHAEFGGLFHQPIDGFVGGHAHHQTHRTHGFAFGGVVGSNVDLRRLPPQMRLQRLHRILRPLQDRQQG